MNRVCTHKNWHGAIHTERLGRRRVEQTYHRECNDCKKNLGALTPEESAEFRAHLEAEYIRLKTMTRQHAPEWLLDPRPWPRSSEPLVGAIGKKPRD